MPPTSKTRSVLKAPKPRQRSAAPQPRLSRTRKPEGLTVEDWQVGLRQQFGRDHAGLALEEQGSDPACGEFSVHNPRYRR